MVVNHYLHIPTQYCYQILTLYEPMYIERIDCMKPKNVRHHEHILNFRAQSAKSSRRLNTRPLEFVVAYLLSQTPLRGEG